MNLKKIDVKIIGDLYDSDIITIKDGEIREEYNADEVLGLVNMLADLQSKLTTQLVNSRIKVIKDTETKEK